MSCFKIHLLWWQSLVCALSAAFIRATIADESESGTAGDCQIGAYRFSDGEIVDIARSEGDTFRWRKFDGTTGVFHKKGDRSWTSTLGWTDRPDGHTASFTHCAAGEIEFDGKKAHRIPFDVTDTDIKVVVRAAGSRRSPQRTRTSISLLLVSD